MKEIGFEREDNDEEKYSFPFFSRNSEKSMFHDRSWEMLRERKKEEGVKVVTMIHGSIKDYGERRERKWK